MTEEEKADRETLEEALERAERKILRLTQIVRDRVAKIVDDRKEVAILLEKGADAIECLDEALKPLAALGAKYTKDYYTEHSKHFVSVDTRLLVRAHAAYSGQACGGCGSPNCSSLWPSQRKCCPDCTHGRKQ